MSTALWTQFTTSRHSTTVLGRTEAALSGGAVPCTDKCIHTAAQTTARPIHGSTDKGEANRILFVTERVNSTPPNYCLLEMLFSSAMRIL